MIRYLLMIKHIQGRRIVYLPISCRMCTYVKPLKDPNLRDTFQRTRLHYSVSFGNINECHRLLQAGADVNVIDAFGSTPLSLACIDKPSIAIVELLLKYNANINLERCNTMDLLLECVLNCNTKLQASIIEILIRHGKNVNATDKITNRSCMHLVALTGYAPLAVLLLKMGAIVNIKDNFNYTPMELAKIHENLEVLSVFKAYIHKSRLI